MERETREAQGIVCPEPSFEACVLDGIEMKQGLAYAEVDRRFRTSARLSDCSQRVMAFYLVEVEEHGLYSVEGYSGTVEYAAEAVGIDRRRTWELIRVGRRLLELRKVDIAFCEGRLGWTKVLKLMRVATPEHEDAWLALAISSTVREFDKEVRLAKFGQAPRKAGTRKGLPEIRFRIGGTVDPVLQTRWEQLQGEATKALGAEAGFAETLEYLMEIAAGKAKGNAAAFRVVARPDEAGHLCVSTPDGDIPLPEGRHEAICCDAEHVHPDDFSELQIDGTTPTELRRETIQRDGHACVCCKSTRGLMVHHIRYRSKGGRTMLPPR